MKELAVTVLFTVMVASGSCAAPPIVKTPVPVVEKQTDKVLVLGWVDGNTYRVAVTGVSKRVDSDSDLKRKSARQSAVLKAQDTVMEKFVMERVKHTSGKPDIRSTGTAVVREFGDVVKNGIVLTEQYQDDEGCKIVYEVKADKLKRAVFGRDLR